MKPVEVLVKEAVHQHVPQAQVNTQEVHKSVWMTKVLKLIKKKRNTWIRYLNTKQPRLSNKGLITHLRHKDGTPSINGLEVAEIFNKQFFSVFTMEKVENMPDFSEKELPDDVQKQLRNLRVERTPD